MHLIFLHSFQQKSSSTMEYEPNHFFRDDNIARSVNEFMLKIALFKKRQYSKKERGALFRIFYRGTRCIRQHRCNPLRIKDDLVCSLIMRDFFTSSQRQREFYQTALNLCNFSLGCKVEEDYLPYH